MIARYTLSRRHLLSAVTLLPAMSITQLAYAQGSKNQHNNVTGSAGMKITRTGSLPFTKGPEEYFTGSVRIDTRFEATSPARASVALVSFEPGARTAWHTHPLGQTLVVATGLGWVQSEGGQKQEIRPGDIVWIPPGEKHWHGATSTTAMSHYAIGESLNGKAVDWLEKVTDSDFVK